MRRYTHQPGGNMFELRTRAAVFTISAFAFAACGGGDGGADTEGAPDNEPSATESAAPAQVANAATINGKVTFTGAAPANKAIDMSEEKACADKHTGGVTGEEVVVKDGNLQ